MLIYSAITSLDGYTTGPEGDIEWSAPDEEVHAFLNDQERGIGTYLYGRGPSARGPAPFRQRDRLPELSPRLGREYRQRPGEHLDDRRRLGQSRQAADRLAITAHRDVR